MKEKKKYYPTNYTMESIISKKSYREYKKINRSKKYHCKYGEYKDISKAIYKEVGKQIIERSGGVYFDPFGYFCVVRSYLKITDLRKKHNTDMKIIKHNLKTGGYVHEIILLGKLSKRGHFGKWSMNGAFNYNVVHPVRAKTASGFKYKMYYKELRDFVRPDLTKKDLRIKKEREDYLKNKKNED